MNSSDAQRAAVIYASLLEAWNSQDAVGFAALFADDADVTGFDGSQMSGRAQIEIELSAIFANHRTASYVAKVREVRSLAPTAILLRAIVGMIPPGASAVKADINAIQSVVFVRDEASTDLRIAHFQNTPAAFHGRPELVETMTRELAAVYEAGRVVDTGASD
ncbi:MAG TPA: SgcJ/EcaC family oxidoreductase [Gemmatimonadaceae bacterium]|jgi:uncharacterized protein (TIGR02246 family)